MQCTVLPSSSSSFFFFCWVFVTPWTVIISNKHWKSFFLKQQAHFILRTHTHRGCPRSCLTLCELGDFSPPGSSVECSSHEYWSGLPFPPPGDGRDPTHHLLCLLRWQADSLSRSYLGCPSTCCEAWGKKLKKKSQHKLLKNFHF